MPFHHHRNAVTVARNRIYILKLYNGASGTASSNLQLLTATCFKIQVLAISVGCTDNIFGGQGNRKTQGLVRTPMQNRTAKCTASQIFNCSMQAAHSQHFSDTQCSKVRERGAPCSAAPLPQPFFNFVPNKAHAQKICCLQDAAF